MTQLMKLFLEADERDDIVGITFSRNGKNPFHEIRLSMDWNVHGNSFYVISFNGHRFQWFEYNKVLSVNMRRYGNNDDGILLGTETLQDVFDRITGGKQKG